MPPPARIRVRCLGYEEEYLLKLQFEATNGIFSGLLEYYCDGEDLAKIGTALSSFPQKSGDEYRYEIGSNKSGDRVNPHFVLRAFTTDALGHSAIEVTVNNYRQGAEASACSFSIPAEAAAINRLGQLFSLLGKRQCNQFIWTERDETLE